MARRRPLPGWVSAVAAAVALGAALAALVSLAGAGRPAAEPAFVAVAGRAAGRGAAVDVGVCTMMKDEAAYVVEWVEHHLSVGVGLVAVYDNGSTDETRRLLSGYELDGAVVVVEWGHRLDSRRQRAAFEHCVATFGPRMTWAALLDVDEFLRPVGFATVGEALGAIDGAAVASAVIVAWSYFCGGPRRAGALVTGAYGFRVPVWREGKQVLRTALLDSQCSFDHPMAVHNCLWSKIPVPVDRGRDLARLGRQVETRRINATVLDASGAPLTGGGTRLPHTVGAHLALNHYREKTLEECVTAARKGGGNRAANRSEWGSWGLARYSEEFCRERRQKACDGRDDALVRRAPELARRVEAYIRRVDRLFPAPAKARA